MTNSPHSRTAAGPHHPVEETPVEETTATLSHRFLKTAAAHSTREAVITPEVRWTYAQTAELSARICAALTASGLRPGERIGLLFSHGAEMIAALLGVLRAGLSYVPLDAAYPEPRLGFMAGDAGIRAIVAGAAHTPMAERIAGDEYPVLAYEDLVCDASEDAGTAVYAAPEAEAYVLYTSGSTGRPKPVAQLHRNVLHHTRVWTDGLRIGPLDRLSLQSAYSWDSAVQDTFSALLSGATLYPVDLKQLGVAGLLEWMAAEQLTVYHSTLPIFRELVRTMEARKTRLPAMRMLALGGDTMHLADLEACRRYFAAHCQVAGAYGSTECSCALLRVVDFAYRPPTGVLPLGEPVPETTVRLEDATGRTVEGPGEGEIVVVSPYLAPGAVTDGRTYRTGDLARRLDDGTLLLIGRRDFQVKISGMRVETGEVESALKALPQVRDAVVMPFTDRLGERQLAAYLVPADRALPDPPGLRSILRRTLPDHAVPTAYVIVNELPLTANHKIDRAALPDPLSRSNGEAEESSPGADNGPEQIIAAVWRDVLGITNPGPDDNFFDLGGTSLRMAAVHERLTRTLAPALRMTDLYRAPTIRALSRLIAPSSSTTSWASPAPADGAEPSEGLARGARRRASRTARRSEVRARTRSQPTASPPPGKAHDTARGDHA